MAILWLVFMSLFFLAVVGGVVSAVNDWRWKHHTH
jgi:hypothetical protein